MFIRVKDLTTGADLNLNSRNIVAFAPAGNPDTSIIRMSDGFQHTVDKTCRSLRHAVSRAQAPLKDEPKAA